MITIAQIIACTEKHYRLKEGEIIGHNREQRVCRPRQIAMYLSYSLTKKAKAEIGRRFDRNHTTVMSNLKRAQSFISDPEIRQDLADIETAVRDMCGAHLFRSRRGPAPLFVRSGAV